MPQIVWLPEALDDASRLFGFLKEKNLSAAARAARAIRQGASRLSDFPELGRPMNDSTGRRELFIPFGAGSYVLRYVLDNHRLVIIRIWHGREQQ